MTIGLDKIKELLAEKERALVDTRRCMDEYDRFRKTRDDKHWDDDHKFRNILNPFYKWKWFTHEDMTADIFAYILMNTNEMHLEREIRELKSALRGPRKKKR